MQINQYNYRKNFILSISLIKLQFFLLLFSDLNRKVVHTPQRIFVREDPEEALRKTHSSISLREAKPLDPAKLGSEVKIVKVAAGFGHTAAITEEGDLYMWGLNMFGQLGIGENSNTKWKPVKVEKDITNNPLPPARDVGCGYNFTYMIDTSGKLYSWGKGYIGHNELTREDRPRHIQSKTENREFTALVCNDQAAVLFAPMRIYSLSPRCGPSCGGTVLSIIGTALKETKKIKVKFTYGEKGHLIQEVDGQYIEERHVDARLGQDQAYLQAVFCKTPKFDEDEGKEGEYPKEKFPQKCKVEITLDGIHYNSCNQDFLIYPSNIKINNAHPKCGPVFGGTELILVVDIDPTLSPYLFNLCVGFQARPANTQPIQKARKDEKKEDLDNSRVVARRNSRMGTITPGGSRFGGGTNTANGLMFPGTNFQINPLDPSEQQLELENWHCSTATYEAGKITCQVPPLNKKDFENLQYNVDIAPNGQQFSGFPVIFRYYNVKIEDAFPKFGPSEGGTLITVKGKGFYDSGGKKFKFESEFGEREMAAAWDRKERCYNCKSPPISWYFGGKSPSAELLSKAKESSIKLLLTLNGQNWIYVGEFKYSDSTIERLAYDLEFGEGLSEEDQEKTWLAEEPLPPAPSDPEALKKQQEEDKKKAEEEEEEINTVYRRTGTHFYIWGSNFFKVPSIKVRFMFEGRAYYADGVYKNEKKIACIIPDMVEIPVGDHKVFVDISFNGQQFTNVGKPLLYNSHDRTLSAEELKKQDEAALKDKKKNAGKAPAASKKKK